jgi:hypothetical protein
VEGMAESSGVTEVGCLLEVHDEDGGRGGREEVALADQLNFCDPLNGAMDEATARDGGEVEGEDESSRRVPAERQTQVPLHNIRHSRQ